MAETKQTKRMKLPGRFEDLVRIMPPRAILDEGDHENMVDMIDRLMGAGRLTRGQAIYLETLVQLVQTYEAAHHAIDTSDIGGLEALKHLLDENGMNASDLARLLGVHPSMGSKILKGERALTADHLRKLSDRFKVSADLFLQR
jgi:HTH-type transcriptional regulator/antitoxin HigA